MTINRTHLAGLAQCVSDHQKAAEQKGWAGLWNTLESCRELIAQAQAAPEAEPVAKVSQETFSSDGTSDIITCNLPIGTKLYADPQHDAELIELLRDCYPGCGLTKKQTEQIRGRIDAKLATLSAKP